MYLGSNSTKQIPRLLPSSLKMEGTSQGTGAGSGASAGAGSGSASASASAPVSASGHLETGGGRVLDLRADASFDQIPKDLPPSKDDIVPKTSTLWGDLRAKYFVPGLEQDDYEDDSFIKATPIKNVGDTGYTFNYSGSKPSDQAAEAKRELEMLFDQVKTAYEESSKREKSGPATDAHATHQYLACRDDYQKRFTKYDKRSTK